MTSSELWIPILASLAVVLALLLVRARSELRESGRALEAEARAELERWKRAAEDEIRRDAVRRSQAAVSGKVAEHLAPVLPEFPFDPRDARFLGAPVDFVVFDGLSAGELREIVFVEVKSGSAAALSPRERQLRDVVASGRVRWSELRLPGPEGEPLAPSYYMPLEGLEGIVAGQIELRLSESLLRYWVDWSEPPLEYPVRPEDVPRLDGRPCLKLSPSGEVLVLDLGDGAGLTVDRAAGRMAIDGRFYRLDPDRLATVRGATVLKLDGRR